MTKKTVEGILADFANKIAEHHHEAYKEILPFETIEKGVAYWTHVSIPFLRTEITALVEQQLKDERSRLKQKAQEYKDKGFELETFIYSGFLEAALPVKE